MRIAVLGATGHTGRMTVAAFRRRGIRVLACGRNEDALAALAKDDDGVETRRVDVSDASDVRAALRGDVDAVANLAGPFLRTGYVPIEAALRQGIPYADTTGEQAFMHEAQARYLRRAEDAGVAVVNALAFEYAFGDLAAHACFPEGGDALHVLYRNRGTQPSAGTAKSILRASSAPSLSYENGALVRAPTARFQRTFDTDDGPRYAMSIPGGEPLTVPQHTPFRTVRTYFAARPRTARLTRALSPLARVALREPILRALERRIDRRHAPPRNEKARGEIRLVAERGGSEPRTVIVRTGDPYAATAEAIAEGLLRLTRTEARGVLAPAAAFDAQSFLSSMEEVLPDFSVENGSATPALPRRGRGENHK